MIKYKSNNVSFEHMTPIYSYLNSCSRLITHYICIRAAQIYERPSFLIKYSDFLVNWRKRKKHKGCLKQWSRGSDAWPVQHRGEGSEGLMWTAGTAAVTLLCAVVPLMEVAADENEAPHGVRWLAEVLAKRERHKMVSRCGAAAKSIK